MALNLNKGDENNAKPDSEKKGLNLNKSNETSKSSLNLSKDKVEPKLPPSSSTDPQTGEKKKSPLLFITAAVAIIGFGIFMYTNKTTIDDVPPPTPAPAETTTEEPAPAETTTEEPASAETTTEEPAPAETPILTGTIEEKARKVISGGFGVGAERKRNLGAEYAEIQAKINEIYRAKY